MINTITILMLLLGVAIGLIAGYLAGRRMARPLVDRLEQLRQDNVKLSSERDVARSQAEHLSTMYEQRLADQRANHEQRERQSAQQMAQQMALIKSEMNTVTEKILKERAAELSTANEQQLGALLNPLHENIRQMREGPKAAVTKAEPRRMRSAADMFSYEVMHDPVTGLYNRRAFDLLMEEAASSHIALLLAESRCDGEPDDDARDHAMCRVSEVLCSCFRPVDFICRIGEDRFAVLMTRVNRSHEDLVLSKVEQINDRLAQAEDGAVPVSLRFGVAFCERDEPAAMLFEDAASALAELPEDDPARCAFH